jgi:hypothetical protein
MARQEKRQLADKKIFLQCWGMVETNGKKITIVPSNMILQFAFVRNKNFRLRQKHPCPWWEKYFYPG